MLHLNQFGVFSRAARDVAAAAIPSSFRKIRSELRSGRCRAIARDKRA